jgi:hypothetical protein
VAGVCKPVVATAAAVAVRMPVVAVTVVAVRMLVAVTVVTVRMPVVAVTAVAVVADGVGHIDCFDEVHVVAVVVVGLQLG